MSESKNSVANTNEKVRFKYIVCQILLLIIYLIIVVSSTFILAHFKHAPYSLRLTSLAVFSVGAFTTIYHLLKSLVHILHTLIKPVLASIKQMAKSPRQKATDTEISQIITNLKSLPQEELEQISRQIAEAQKLHHST